MGSKTYIEREPSFEDIQRFMTKELKPRVRAVQKKVVQSIALAAQEGIQDHAPKDPRLKNYQKDLTTVGLTGDYLVYSVLYKGRMEKGKDQDMKTTLLFIRPIKRKKGKWTGVFRILAHYQPFTLDTWPVKIPQDRAVIVYRQDNERNVQTMRERNIRQSGEIILKLQKSGIRLRKSDFNVNADKLDITEDLAFKIVRMEKGIGGEQAKPHWKPGIESAKSNDSLSKIQQDEDITKALSDPNFRGWKKLGKIKDRISPEQLDDIEKFQKMIIGENP